MTIRLVDAGTVSWLRSQSLYHGLAYARTDATPDTIVFATPAEPYVCIGFHQDVDRELDRDFCMQRGLAIVRRETGGGAVYLDRDQMFVQWVMGESSLSPRVDQRFERFARPLVETYRWMGIDAAFRPVNDVHVRGRKISGTGAARIGNAEVLVGNFLFDFDVEVMTRVLRAPSEEFRAQLGHSLGEYMTWVRRELGTVPDRGGVAARYRAACADALGRPIEPGELTAAEFASIAAVEERFVDPRFRDRPGGLRRRGVKIHEDVHVVETRRAGAAGTGAAGTIVVTARLREGRIEEISFTGPLTAAEGLRLGAALRGIRPEGPAVADTVRDVLGGGIGGGTRSAAIDACVGAIRDLGPPAAQRERLVDPPGMTAPQGPARRAGTPSDSRASIQDHDRERDP